MDFAPTNLVPAYAELFVLGMACLILLVDLFLSDQRRWITATLTLATLAGAAVITTYVSGVSERVTAFNGMYVADPMGDVLKLFLYLIVGVSLLYARSYLAKRGLFRGEYYVLTLFALLGIMVMISANSLLTLYLGVELLALSLYAMVAFNRDSGVAAEAAMKYFVLGAIASGTLLYGMSIIYGVTGTLHWTAWPRRWRTARPTISVCCSASHSSWSASPSSSARCRSTCGCRTCITARRRR